MRKERVGFAVCGSFCTHEKVLKALEALTGIYETVIPIVSEISAFTDTRFGRSEDLLERLEDLTGNDVLLDIPSVEPSHGEYHRQAGGGHRGHVGDHGGQVPSAERPAGGAGGVQQRRPGGGGEEHRRAAGPAELFLRALRAG